MKKEIVEEDIKMRIPENCLKSKRYFGFRLRNIIEGLIFTSIVGVIIFQIPFVPRVKAIFIVIIGLVVLLICCNGIKNQSITEIFQNISYNSKYKKQYHLRSVRYARKQNKFKISQSKITVNQSAAQKIYESGKDIFFRIKEALQSK